MSILVLTSDTLIGTPATGNLEYNGQFFGTDSNASRAQLQRIVRATAVASTSGTSITFSSIPSWVERITVALSGVSVSGTQVMQVQLGTGGVATTSGYAASAGIFVTGNITSANSLTTGFAFNNSGGGGATQTWSGLVTLVSITGNTWVCSAQVTDTTNVRMGSGGGVISLAGVLDMIRLTTVGGTDTFDAGTVNIIYEG
jgi:hypothetical protein